MVIDDCVFAIDKTMKREDARVIVSDVNTSHGAL